MDREEELQVVGQVLVQVRQRLRVHRELLVLAAQHIAGGHVPEALQVHHVQRRDVVRPPTQITCPVALLPEPEALHVLGVVAHRRVAVRRAVQVHVHQLLQVVAHNLVRIHKDDPVQVQREEHVEEEDFVGPDHALLLRLLPQPVWPRIGDQLIGEPVLLGQMRYERLERGREEVLDEPELDAALGVPQHREDHDVRHALVQVPAGQRKDVDVRVRAAAEHAAAPQHALCAAPQCIAELASRGPAAAGAGAHVLRVLDQLRLLLARALGEPGVHGLAQQGVERQPGTGHVQRRAVPAVAAGALHRVQLVAAPLTHTQVPAARVRLELEVAQVLHHNRVQLLAPVVRLKQQLEPTGRGAARRERVALDQHVLHHVGRLDACLVRHVREAHVVEVVHGVVRHRDHATRRLKLHGEHRLRRQRFERHARRHLGAIRAKLWAHPHLTAGEPLQWQPAAMGTRVHHHRHPHAVQRGERTDGCGPLRRHTRERVEEHGEPHRGVLIAEREGGLALLQLLHCGRARRAWRIRAALASWRKRAVQHRSHDLHGQGARLPLRGVQLEDLAEHAHMRRVLCGGRRAHLVCIERDAVQRPERLPVDQQHHAAGAAHLAGKGGAGSAPETRRGLFRLQWDGVLRGECPERGAGAVRRAERVEQLAALERREPRGTLRGKEELAQRTVGRRPRGVRHVHKAQAEAGIAGQIETVLVERLERMRHHLAARRRVQVAHHTKRDERCGVRRGVHKRAERRDSLATLRAGVHRGLLRGTERRGQVRHRALHATAGAAAERGGERGAPRHGGRQVVVERGHVHVLGDHAVVQRLEQLPELRVHCAHRIPQKVIVHRELLPIEERNARGGLGARDVQPAQVLVRLLESCRVCGGGGAVVQEALHLRVQRVFAVHTQGACERRARFPRTRGAVGGGRKLVEQLSDGPARQEVERVPEHLCKRLARGVLAVEQRCDGPAQRVAHDVLAEYRAELLQGVGAAQVWEEDQVEQVAGQRREARRPARGEQRAELAWPVLVGAVFQVVQVGEHRAALRTVRRVHKQGLARLALLERGAHRLVGQQQDRRLRREPNGRVAQGVHKLSLLADPRREAQHVELVAAHQLAVEPHLAHTLLDHFLLQAEDGVRYARVAAVLAACVRREARRVQRELAGELLQRTQRLLGLQYGASRGKAQQRHILVLERTLCGDGVLGSGARLEAVARAEVPLQPRARLEARRALRGRDGVAEDGCVVHHVQVAVIDHKVINLFQVEGRCIAAKVPRRRRRCLPLIGRGCRRRPPAQHVAQRHTARLVG